MRTLNLGLLPNPDETGIAVVEPLIIEDAIRIEITAEEIQRCIFNLLREDYPHRAALSEAIVGIMSLDGRLAQLVGALNGERPRSPYKPGDPVYCSSTYRVEHPEIQGEYLTKERGHAVVSKVKSNPYSENTKVQIRWKPTESSKEQYIWVEESTLRHCDLPF